MPYEARELSRDGQPPGICEVTMNIAKLLITALAGRAINYVGIVENASWWGDVIAYWPMDDPSGSTARDEKGNNRTAALGAGVTVAQPGKYGLSYTLSGAASAAISGNAAYLAAFTQDEFTVMGWSKLTTHNATARMLFECRVDASNYAGVQASTGINDLRSMQRGGGAAVVNTSAVDFDPTAAWFHWCITHSWANTRLRLYINGVKSATDGLLTNQIAGAIAGAGILNYLSGPMIGGLQHVVTVGRELTATEIGEVVFF